MRGFTRADDFDPGELTCQQLAETITDYLEAVLPEADRRRFGDHLLACDDCTLYVEQLRVTIAAAGRIAADDIPPAVRTELLAAFRGWAAGTS